jgi:phage gpG-like protein
MIYVRFDDSVLQNKINNYEVNIRKALTEEITKLSIKLTNHIRTDKLTGTVLNVRTGRLRNSIKYNVSSNSNQVIGIVSTNVVYARIHEYGSKGSVNVNGFTRKISQAFGKSITPKTVDVKSHIRRVNMPERSFMRSSLADMKSEILNKIKGAVVKVDL